VIPMTLLRSTPSGPTDHAVDLRRRVRLGGRPQQIQVLAARVGLPVLLVLHGGPGFANGRAFLDRHAALAEHFTLVTWDQRGAGASFFGAGRSRLTVNTLVEDAAELVSRVAARNPGAPVYVLGQSWGSELGILLVKRHPEHIAGYVGSGQAVDGVHGEALSWSWALDQAVRVARDRTVAARTRRAARRDVALLHRVGPPRLAQYRPVLLGLAIQRSVLGRYLPLPGEYPVDAGEDAAAVVPPRRRYAWPVPLAERIGSRLGVVRSLSQLWPTATSYDFRSQAPRLGVPVWFFQGRHDHTTPSDLVEEYAALLEAPRVNLVWFEGSGHSPARDEPSLFRQRLVDALTPGDQTESDESPGENR